MFGKKSDENPEAEMGFFDHIDVLRWHLLRSAIAIIVIAVVLAFNEHFVFDVFLFGPAQSNFVTYRLLCTLSQHFSLGNGLCINDMSMKFMNTELFGQFTVQLQTAFMLGFVFAFPYVVFELWRFVKPALSDQEARKTSITILMCSFFFFVGVCFGYFILVPFSLNFSFHYLVSGNIQNMISLDNYIDFITVMIMGCGIVFELPMVVYFLAKLGILGPGVMRSFRRHAIVIILIVAAVITPSPDVFTQSVVAVPIYILYELSIFIAAAVERNRIKAESIHS